MSGSSRERLWIQDRERVKVFERNGNREVFERNEASVCEKSSSETKIEEVFERNEASVCEKSSSETKIERKILVEDPGVRKILV